MIRIQITVGLLSIIGVIAITMLVGFGEEQRMWQASRAWEAREIEAGALLYEQYCASCHGPNASGGIGPPLDETSGLHGGDLGAGVAWRLEELGWPSQDSYEYVLSVLESGRSVSTRPEQYPGDRAEDPTAMAMPAWSEAYGGPLRPDQAQMIALYIASFRDALDDAASP